MPPPSEAVPHGGTRTGAGRKKVVIPSWMSRRTFFRLKQKGIDPATYVQPAETFVEAKPETVKVIETPPTKAESMKAKNKARDPDIKEKIARLRQGLPLLAKPEPVIADIPTYEKGPDGRPTADVVRQWFRDRHHPAQPSKPA
jgi:hypothetical protein